jgi:hypothetical protein
MGNRGQSFRIRSNDDFQMESCRRSLDFKRKSRCQKGETASNCACLRLLTALWSVVFFLVAQRAIPVSLLMFEMRCRMPVFPSLMRSDGHSAFGAMIDTAGVCECFLNSNNNEFVASFFVGFSDGRHGFPFLAALLSSPKSVAWAGLLHAKYQRLW